MKLQRSDARVDPHDQYTDEYFKYLLDKELTRSSIEFKSPQIHLRTQMIRWLASLNKEKFLYGRSTFFLGVRLLDEFMDRFDVCEHRLYAVTIICLHIAAKHEECEVNLPKLSGLVAVLKGVPINYPREAEITVKSLYEIEVFILKCLKVRIFRPTVPHFLDFFVARLVTDGHFSKYGVEIMRKQFNQKLDEILTRFFFDSPKARSLANSRPSCMAASCLLIARSQFRLTPLWPLPMEELTGYTMKDLECTTRAIIKAAKDGKEDEVDQELRRKKNSPYQTEPRKKLKT